MASSSQDQIALTWTPEFASYTHTTEHDAWVISSLKAPFFEPTARAPVDIVAVIDRSGSMRGEKLDLVKETLEFVIDQLKSCDRLSVVSYDTNVRVDFPLTNMDETNKEKTKKTVMAMRDGSSTNLSGGLFKGMEQISTRTGEMAKVSSVLLLTDGLANVGITSREQILDEMSKLLDPSPSSKDKPFEGTVYTFGFGSDHDARMLEAISTSGGGVYYYIDSTEKIPESFADCLGGLLSVVGQNLSLKLECNGGNTITNVHTSRKVTWKKPNKCCEITMGDLQSEENRDFLLEVKLPALPSPTADDVVTATLSYFNVITSSLSKCSEILKLDRPGAGVDPGPPNVKVDMQRNRNLVSEALKKARLLADESKFDEARKLLTDTSKTVSESVSVKEEYCQGLLSDIKSSLDAMASRQQYRSHGQHYLMNKMQSHCVQRSNFASEFSSYQSPMKAEMVVKSKARKK